MDFSYILKSAKYDETLLLKYGFNKPETADLYSMKKRFSVAGSDFYVIFEISESSFSGRIFEQESDEVYALAEVPSAVGSFVTEVRRQVQDLAEDIRERCFVSTDTKKKFMEFVRKHFGVPGDNPFREESPDTMVFRTPEKSWFALVMTVSFKNLGFRSDAPVSVVNLKHRPEHIPEIVDNHRIFNAYHMNKKHWITVILSDNMDFDLLRELTEESYKLVTGKRG